MKSPKDLLKLDDQFCFAVYTVSRLVTQSYEPLLKALDLTYPQYLVMLILWEADAVNLTHLSERLQLDAGTLTPLVKRLETKGFLTKVRAKNDERSVVISLTKEGQALKRKAKDIPHGLICRLGSDTETLIQLRDDLKTLLASINKQKK